MVALQIKAKKPRKRQIVTNIYGAVQKNNFIFPLLFCMKSLQTTAASLMNG